MGLAAAPAHAIIPVIDIAAIQTLVQEITAWAEQLRGMQLQLTQMQQTYASMTGLRGMEQVLRVSTAARNYLPPDWSTLEASIAGAATAYPQIAAAVRAQSSANSVLTNADLERFSAPLQALLANQRQGAAGDQTLSRLAYATSSDRFTSLATLIDRIGATPDGKAIAELQGRIEAEQAMLANDGLKLAALAQSSTAEAAARALSVREQVVANHGSFAARFQPTPPAP
jgi:type IV secretion system protein VirB5